MHGIDYRTQPPVTLEPLSYPNVSVDWEARGAVTPVQNQGNCGSCWAFAAAGAIEGVVAIKYGTLTPLSEQQILDCSNAGTCQGGWTNNAFRYATRNAICPDSAYPYTGRRGLCRANRCSPAPNAKIAGYANVATNENALGAALDRQPIAIALDADSRDFQYYRSGVLCSASCGRDLNHALVLTGYGTSEKGVDYWRIKNSWGTSWGDRGYINLCRNRNMCGIADAPSYPYA